MATAPPPSPPAGFDVIYRTDGTVLRGTVSEVVPGVEVRIETMDGQTVAVPRHDIMRVERTRPPGDASDLHAPGRPDRSTTWVHLNGPDVAELQRYDGDAGGWRTVCTPPCNSLLPSGLRYRVTGPGLRPSDPFSLGGEYGGYDSVTVHGASRSGFVTGMVAIIAGGSALLLTGLVVVGEDSLGGGGGRGASSTVLDVAAVGGLASLAIGLGLAIANGSTRIAQSVPDPNSSGPSPGPYATDLERRSPSALWPGERKEDVAQPRSFALPLLGGRF